MTHIPGHTEPDPLLVGVDGLGGGGGSFPSGQGTSTVTGYTDQRTVVLNRTAPSYGPYDRTPRSQQQVGTVSAAKDAFSGALLNNDPDTIAIAKWMYDTRIIPYDITKNFEAGYGAATSAYNAAVSRAADSAFAAGIGNSKTVLDMLTMKMGSGAYADGSGSSTSKQIMSYTMDQARKKAIDAYRTIIDRDPTEQEINEFANGLINSAKATPAVQKVSKKGGATVQETTQGFDEKTWTLGFMAGKIPADGDLRGAAGAAQDMVATFAEQYGYRPTSTTKASYVRDIIEGRLDQNSLEQAFKEQAKILYPHLSDKIDAGLNPRKIADPYIANTMNILEKSVSEVDMFSPYIKEALSYKDANGMYALPTADEHASMLRNKQEWLETRNAKESLMGAADNILKQMGFE